MDFTPITSQEQLESVIKDRINRERDTVNKKFEGYTSPDDLKKIKDDYAKQIADLTKNADDLAKKYADYDKKIAEKDANIKGYETNLVKMRIAHETGLPYELAGRLSGDSEDAIKKDAENLVKLIGNGQKKAPLADPEGDEGNAGGKNASLLALAKSLKGED
ncbi:MAG: hypothetical protein PUF17_10490 [Lactimicrobium massiliense]|nr:hypothetical protein [Lactimicrobium massiliense]MDD6561373.1 hypothetical protein [Lactimicrobium massiliense]